LLWHTLQISRGGKNIFPQLLHLFASSRYLWGISLQYLAGVDI